MSTEQRCPTCGSVSRGVKYCLIPVEVGQHTHGDDCIFCNDPWHSGDSGAPEKPTGRVFPFKCECGRLHMLNEEFLIALPAGDSPSAPQPDQRAKMKAELLEEIKNDPANMLFGLPLNEVRKRLYEWEERNAPPAETSRTAPEPTNTTAGVDTAKAALMLHPTLPYCKAVRSTSTGCGSYLDTDRERHLCELSQECDGDTHLCSCGFRWSWQPNSEKEAVGVAAPEGEMPTCGYFDSRKGKFCGKPENDRVHAKYGNDLDSPWRHIFEAASAAATEREAFERHAKTRPRLFSQLQCTKEGDYLNFPIVEAELAFKAGAAWQASRGEEPLAVIQMRDQWLADTERLGKANAELITRAEAAEKDRSECKAAWEKSRQHSSRLQAQLESAEGQLTAVTQDIHNLMAVIFRDGGHKAATFATTKEAGEAAEAEVLRERGQLAALRERLIHISFSITGNDVALIEADSQGVEKALAAYRDTATEVLRGAIAYTLGRECISDDSRTKLMGALAASDPGTPEVKNG